MAYPKELSVVRKKSRAPEGPSVREVIESQLNRVFNAIDGCSSWNNPDRGRRDWDATNVGVVAGTLRNKKLRRL